MTKEQLRARIDLCTFGGFVQRKEARLQLLREIGNSVLNRQLVDSLIAGRLKLWLRDTGRTPEQTIHLVHMREGEK